MSSKPQTQTIVLLRSSLRANTTLLETQDIKWGTLKDTSVFVYSSSNCSGGAAAKEAEKKMILWCFNP